MGRLDTTTRSSVGTMPAYGGGMKPIGIRVLVVDDEAHHLSDALSEFLVGHEVDVACDAFDAIYRLDCATEPYAVIFCDLACGELPGPELWAYLSLTRSEAARRTVFVASGPLRQEAREFMARTRNPLVELPQRPTAGAARRTGRRAPMATGEPLM